MIKSIYMIYKKGNAIANLLYFFMASVIVALFMPTVKEFIAIGVNNITNSTHGIILTLIFTYWPVFFVIMMLVILIILMRS